MDKKLNVDHQYLNLIKHVLKHGVLKSDRTKTGVLSSFNHNLVIPMSEGFPLLTTKRLFFGGIFDELQWFISGSTNVNDLPKRTQKWWTPWADVNGDLGPTYGHQYKTQLDELINGIKTNPDSRRHVITMWNGYDAKNCNLPPCHGTVIQFYIREGQLDLSTYQRSVDCAIGLPVNIASYALLLHMVAHECNLEPGIMYYTLGDTHIYLDHMDGLREQIDRKPNKLPTIELNQSIKTIRDFQISDVLIKDYNPLPSIKFNISV